MGNGRGAGLQTAAKTLQVSDWVSERCSGNEKQAKDDLRKNFVASGPNFIEIVIFILLTQKMPLNGSLAIMRAIGKGENLMPKKQGQFRGTTPSPF